MNSRILPMMICTLAVPAAPLSFHVSPHGSDGGSGDAGHPFATVARARDAIREIKRKGGGLQQPVTVYLHGGIYTLAAPLEFTAEDSGTAECPVTYTSWKDEKPILSGGRRITGWKQATVGGKHLWTADVPAVRAGEWYFRELWMNGRRAVRARNPNQGFLRVTGVPDLDMRTQYQIGNSSFQFAPGEIERWPDLDDAEVVFLNFWISTRRHIANLDEASRTATLDKPTPMRLTDGFGRTPLARYYVENAFELLDAPAEWYLNRKTGTIYYMPPSGEDIARAEAVAPVLDHLLSLAGDPKQGHPVEHLTFRGITFAHAEFWLPQQDRGFQFERQAAAPMPGAVRLYGARHCTFDHCTITHVSSYGIHFGRGCDHDRLAGSELSDLGTGGVKIGEPDRIGNMPPGMQNPLSGDPKLETHDIEVTGNDIREGGRVFHQGIGVLLLQSYNNLVAHNEIHDFYQIAISAGWTWGYGKSLAHNNVIEYNHLHQIGQGWSSDLAAVYTLGEQPGTVIRHNLIHDVECADYIGRGIYLDEGSTDMVVEDNIIYNTSTGGFGMNFGRRNTIRNNVFAFGDRSQIEPIGNMQKAPPGSSYVLERNIFLWKAGKTFVGPQWQPRPSDELVFRDNLFWQEGGGEVNLGPLAADRARKVADPLFVAPAKYDFHLKPDSPARGMGFHPIDLSTVGATQQ